MKQKSIWKKLLLGILGAGLLLSGCAGDPTGPIPAPGSGTGETMNRNTETETEEKTEKTTEKKTESSTTPGGQNDREDFFNSLKYKNPWKTGIEATGADGKTFSLREVTIDIPGDGDPIVIYHMTDIHFNSSETQDDEEALSRKWWGNAFADNDTILASYWRCMNYAAANGADRIVLTGDIANFYSKANYKVMEDNVFRAEMVNAALAGKILLTSGNHDCTFPNAKSNMAQYESHHKELEDLYKKYGYDLEYTSQVLDERVMLVVLDNASWYDVRSARFTQNQLDRLTKDVELAREKGYVMLLFAHVPLPTKNANGHSFYIDYDSNAYNDAASKDVYDLITNSADVIKGYFTGHNHGDEYLEIVAKTPDGKPAFIPQYVLRDMGREKEGGTGEMTRIILK